MTIEARVCSQSAPLQPALRAERRLEVPRSGVYSHWYQRSISFVPMAAFPQLFGQMPKAHRLQPEMMYCTAGAGLLPKTSARNLGNDAPRKEQPRRGSPSTSKSIPSLLHPTPTNAPSSKANPRIHEPSRGRGEVCVLEVDAVPTVRWIRRRPSETNISTCNFSAGRFLSVADRRQLSPLWRCAFLVQDATWDY